MPGFRGCYRLVIDVLTLLVTFPLLWIWNNIRNQLVLRIENREPVEQEDQEGKLCGSMYALYDSVSLVGFCVVL